MTTHCPNCGFHLDAHFALERMREAAGDSLLPGDWVDTKTAARLIGKSESWLRRAKPDAKYPGPVPKQQAGRVRYHIAALVEWQLGSNT